MEAALRKVYWSDLTSRDFQGLDPETTLAVLPVAAIEQHGPHLPLATDMAIGEGMIHETLARLPEDLSILVLPMQAIGKSDEHVRLPGTLTLSAETAIRAWTEIGEAVQRAGLRKLVIVNAHGGNVEVMGIVARDLRAGLDMLVVTTHWDRFGVPPGLYPEDEVATGIHGGDVETSLMLHFRPDLVRMDQATDFTPVTLAMREEFAFLRPTGHHAFAWLAEDLHPEGVAGNAAAATAEKGRATAQWRAERFIALLRDVTRFSLDRLA
ncbi:MAG TPA: creatininase family protein [Xanthobacteraceae bacterium]|nr:creatininase family protein [Xanthobacteraceae bacterium]